MLTNLRGRLADFISPELARDRRDALRASRIDPLTGLANRAALDLALPAAELDPNTSIVFFDANNFGKLNKRAGHKFGDVILREIAAVIATTANVYGIRERVFRYGGDEFVVLCPADVADRFRRECEWLFGPPRYEGIGVSISGTVGPDLASSDSTLQARKRSHKLELVK